MLRLGRRLKTVILTPMRSNISPMVRLTKTAMFPNFEILTITVSKLVENLLGLVQADLQQICLNVDSAMNIVKVRDKLFNIEDDRGLLQLFLQGPTVFYKTNFILFAEERKIVII